ncbi:unnamed protein product, partial [Rotaria socialis]
LCIPTGYGSIS